MSPTAHFLASWLVADAFTDNARDRRLVTFAGLAADLDGLGLVVDAVNIAAGGPEVFTWYVRYHHFLLHGIFGGLLIAAAAAAMARRRWRVTWLSLVVFHLHLVCDLAGSRGQGPGDIWPIFYLGPFAKDPMWFWRGQWALDSWLNGVITAALIGATLWLAIRRGRSPVGVFSPRADVAVVATLRKWAGRSPVAAVPPSATPPG